MRRLMITGGAGFIGANFVHYWLKHHGDDFVLVLDKLTYAGNPDNLNGLDASPNFRFVRGDICNFELVEYLLREYEIDTIVHFAAESHVDRSVTGPDAFVQTNVMGTHSLLKAARAVWLSGKAVSHRFHHISTDEVYGSLGPDDPAFSENTPYAPNSPYSASKAASDHLVRSYGHTYGLNYTISNCSNNFGPYQFPEKLIPLSIINILLGRPIPVYGDGQNVRDWLYVEDHCVGLDLILQKASHGEVYNIGGNNQWRNLELIRLLCRHLNEFFAKDSSMKERFPGSPCARNESAESLITFVKDRPGHDRRYAIDASKMERELEFRVSRDFSTALKKTISWYLQNEGWWRKLL
ncbi:MAG: dTDP-glucose 4,6-dehydratase [Dissulfuribacterales bacterium]